MCSLVKSHYLDQEVYQMSDELDLPALRKEVLQIADNKMHQVAKMVTNDLRLYALQHQRTGDMLRNIRLLNESSNGVPKYIIDGGKRADYANKGYHPITFFIYEPAKRTLTDVLRRARNEFED